MDKHNNNHGSPAQNKHIQADPETQNDSYTHQQPEKQGTKIPQTERTQHRRTADRDRRRHHHTHSSN
eukprot:10369072-Prorocentrum_lima.AAC.1